MTAAIVVGAVLWVAAVFAGWALRRQAGRLDDAEGRGDDAEGRGDDAQACPCFMCEGYDDTDERYEPLRRASEGGGWS